MSKRAMPNTQQLPLAVWRTLDCELSLHKSYLNEILIFHNVRSSACHLAIKKDEHLGIKQRSTTLTRCLPLEVPHIHMLGQRCLHFSEEEERKRERENNLDLLQEKKRKKKKKCVSNGGLPSQPLIIECRSLFTDCIKQTRPVTK